MMNTKPLALLTAAALGFGAISVEAVTHPSTPSTTVTVREGVTAPFALKVGRATVPAGRITFRVANKAALPHELVLLRTAHSASAIPGPKSKVSETGLVGETGDIAAHGAKSFTTTLGPGHYVLMCNLTGHYAAGMHMDFTVR